MKSLMKVAAEYVINFTKGINSHFVVTMDHKTCTHIICTYGLKKQVYKTSDSTHIIFKQSKVGGEGFVGFSNSLHCDSCDKLTTSQQESTCTGPNELGPFKYSNMQFYCERTIKYKGI